jgi:hypothetical protein
LALCAFLVFVGVVGFQILRSLALVSTPANVGQRAFGSSSPPVAARPALPPSPVPPPTSAAKFLGNDGGWPQFEKWQIDIFPDSHQGWQETPLHVERDVKQYFTGTGPFAIAWGGNSFSAHCDEPIDQWVSCAVTLCQTGAFVSRAFCPGENAPGLQVWQTFPSSPMTTPIRVKAEVDRPVTVFVNYKPFDPGPIPLQTLPAPPGPSETIRVTDTSGPYAGRGPFGHSWNIEIFQNSHQAWQETPLHVEGEAITTLGSNGPFALGWGEFSFSSKCGSPNSCSITLCPNAEFTTSGNCPGQATSPTVYQTFPRSPAGTPIRIRTEVDDSIRINVSYWVNK